MNKKEIKVNKHGFFNLPILAIGEQDIYCPICYEVLTFNKPAAAGVYSLVCPICNNPVTYHYKGENNG